MNRFSISTCYGVDGQALAIRARRCTYETIDPPIATNFFNHTSFRSPIKLSIVEAIATRSISGQNWPY